MTKPKTPVVIALLLLLLILFVLPLPTLGQVAVVVKPVNLRPEPSTSNPPIQVLLPPERLQLIQPKEQGSYYRIRTDSGERGWVWKSNVQVYKRNDWMKGGKWADADGDCQDTRQEVLIQESKVPVTLDPSGCRVVSGQWIDPYGGEVFTDPRTLQIDHVVPLANAHISGGWAWDNKRQEAYANDLKNPEHLLAVKGSLNMQKSDKSPDKWKPPRQDFWCEYATIWLKIKDRWGLILTAKEAMAVAEMKTTCH